MASNGVLYLKYGHRIIYDSASWFEARVDSVLKDKQWHWKPTRLEHLVIVHRNLFLSELKEEDWTASSSAQFVCAATCDALRSKGAKVNWWRLIWFTHHIPRHSFIGWMALQNKHPTKDE